MGSAPSQVPGQGAVSTGIYLSVTVPYVCTGVCLGPAVVN